MAAMSKMSKEKLLFSTARDARGLLLSGFTRAAANLLLERLEVRNPLAFGIREAWQDRQLSLHSFCLRGGCTVRNTYEIERYAQVQMDGRKLLNWQLVIGKRLKVREPRTVYRLSGQNIVSTTLSVVHRKPGAENVMPVPEIDDTTAVAMAGCLLIAS